jgi:hypothetical protein
VTNIEIDFMKLPSRSRYSYGEYVLYRDPGLYWAGRSGHTFPCRVELNLIDLTLRDLRTGREIADVDPDYVRLLPAVDAMRDIDAAPLNGEHPGLAPAAVAWLEQDAKPAGGDV